MNTSQSLVLSENFNFAIWIEADIVSAENKVCFNEVKTFIDEVDKVDDAVIKPQFGRSQNKVCFNEVKTFMDEVDKVDDEVIKPQFGRSQNIFSGCLKSLQALDLLQKQFPQDVLRMTIAFGADFWQSLNHTQEGRELKNFPAYGNGLAVATQHDLLIHIQSLSAMSNIALMQNVLSAFGDSITVRSEEYGYRLHEARGLDGFVDGTENPHDLADIQRIGVIDNTQPDAGGSYVLLQKYQHNLSQWQSYSLAQQEESVGRSKIDNIEFSREERHIRSHLSRTNLKENSGSLKIVRRSLPYGKAEGECGLMFCAYCHTLYNLEKQLQTMFGDVDGQTDFLIERLSKTLSGAYYFAPSVERLRNLSQAG